MEGKHIDQWAAFNFGAYERFKRLNPYHFIPHLSGAAQILELEWMSCFCTSPLE